MNHANDGSGDATNNQIKNESEPIAQQIEVWIEERKYEIGTYNVIVTLQCFRNVQLSCHTQTKTNYSNLMR